MESKFFNKNREILKSEINQQTSKLIKTSHKVPKKSSKARNIIIQKR